MNTSSRAMVALVLAVLGAVAFDSPEEALLDRVRTAAAGNIKLIPRYTCVQTVNRTRYALPVASGDCGEATALQARRVATWHDRLRLDVAVGEGTDLYSWVGASRFDNDQVAQLAARGMSASGEFSSLLAGVFGGDAGDFRFLGDLNTPSGKLASFGFVTPLARSHYNYGTSQGHVTVGYRGTFLADPTSGDLRQLRVTADNLPANVCRMESTVDYARLKIGDGDFVLPVTSTVDVLYRDGRESRNETLYAGCRQYAGESSVRFDDQDGPSPLTAGQSTGIATPTPAKLPPLPPRARLRVRIAPSINASVAAAGDPIVGIIDAAVKDQGRVVANAGDKLHGRILRLEYVTPVAAGPARVQTAAELRQSYACQQCGAQVSDARPYWVVALVFDTIERSGVRAGIALRAVDDGYRFGDTRKPVPESERPVGGGIFIFGDDEFVSGRPFESTWEIR